MNQVNHSNFHDSSSEVLLKRKRGRPRKYPKPDIDGNAQISKNQILNQTLRPGVHLQVRPVSDGAAVNLPLQREPVDSANKAMIGQVVSGVIDAVFDAGFLLSVRVGDSDTTLRGVVFKPGRYVPVSPENDVVPDVPMIKRNEVPFPSGYHTQGNSSFSEQNAKRHRNETHSMIALPAANQDSRVEGSYIMEAAKGKQAPVVAGQQTVPAGRDGNLPVGLQNFDSSNVVSVSDQPSLVVSQASHILSTKGKEVQESSNPANGPAAISQVPMACSQSPCSRPQKSSTDGMQNKDSLHQYSLHGQQELEAKKIRFPSMPFEKLLSEAFKIIQPPFTTIESEVDHSKASGSTSANDAKVDQEDQANNMDQTPAITSLQTPQPHLKKQSAAASKASETH